MAKRHIVLIIDICLVILFAIRLKHLIYNNDLELILTVIFIFLSIFWWIYEGFCFLTDPKYSFRVKADEEIRKENRKIWLRYKKNPMIVIEEEEIKEEVRYVFGDYWEDRFTQESYVKKNAYILVLAKQGRLPRYNYKPADFKQWHRPEDEEYRFAFTHEKLYNENSKLNSPYEYIFVEIRDTRPREYKLVLTIELKSGNSLERLRYKKGKYIRPW